MVGLQTSRVQPLRLGSPNMVGCIFFNNITYYLTNLTKISSKVFNEYIVV